MMTVVVYINGHPILARSVRRVKDASHDNAEAQYLCDDGRTICHNPDYGACRLAIKMLEGTTNIDK